MSFMPSPHHFPTLANRKHSKKFTYNQKLLLAKLYHQGWDVYEGRVQQGEATINGKPRPSRKQLIVRWTSAVNALDGAEKTPVQVQQRVNDMKKRVRQYRDQIKDEILTSNGRIESIREMSPASKIVDSAMQAQEEEGEPTAAPEDFDDDFSNVADNALDFDDSRFNIDIDSCVKEEDRDFYESRESSSKSPSLDSEARMPTMRTRFVPANSAGRTVIIRKRPAPCKETEEDLKLQLLREEIATAKLKRQREEEALKSDRELYEMRKQLLKKALRSNYSIQDDDILEDEVLDEESKLISDFRRKRSAQ
ncbi:hypothetical protein QR680_018480 [Steinernema hermaphroditum]|uniref:Uncharacterized protein n=1 Tax=Steinernema hermaphroditum TaxID=289476 RepID=A0AA39HKF1_9BILA|nr:hypothetical protein QR680_018480 [Steinernema hermaphroditum]